MENGFAHTDLEDYDLVFDRHYHGRNIKLDEDGKSAQKIKKGAKEALLVTNRPLASNELFEVELGQGSGFKGVKQEVKQIMKGKESIRIGVTIHCPSDVVTLSTQHSMKRMDTGTWMMMAEQVVDSGEVTMSLQKYSLKELNIGDRVGIIRLPEFQGSLVIFINGAPIGIIATGVPENVYGFAEMQGDCEKICISAKRTIKQEALPIEVRSVREKQMELKQMKKELEEKEDQVEMLEGQLELLRKQVIRMKSLSQHSIQQSHGKLDITQDTETQTSPISMQNGRHACNSPSSSQYASKKTCCVIL